MNGDRHPTILGPVDKAFFYVERPETPMNIGALTIFEGTICFEEFVKLIDSRIHQAPIYRKRIIQAPLNVGELMWVFDPDFYIGNHVFRITVDPPGADEQVRELTGHLISGTLDHSRPLWEAYLIEGLAGNCTGIFFKVHHCMVDGLAAVEIFTLLMDLTPETAPPPKKPLYDPPYLPDLPGLLLESVRADLPHKLGILQKLGHDALFLGSVLADKEKRRRTFVGIANLINDNLSPIKKLAINGVNTGRITLAWSEFSLAEIRLIKSDQGASVNDVMLTILLGAVENYLKGHGGTGGQDFLRVLVPVNMRIETEKASFGNRISVLPVDLPFGILDPLERLRRIAEYSRVMKESSLSNGLDLILTVPSLAPSVIQPVVWRIAPSAFSFLAHMWCTNIAGPQIPIYLLGHQMLHSFGYFPLNPSMGLACVIASYNQRISMTLIADAGIVPDVTELNVLLNSAFQALRKAANLPEIEPVALSKPKLAANIGSPSMPVAPEAPAETAESAESPVSQSSVEAKAEPSGVTVQIIEEPVAQPAVEPVLSVEPPIDPVHDPDPAIEIEVVMETEPGTNGKHSPEPIDVTAPVIEIRPVTPEAPCPELGPLPLAVETQLNRNANPDVAPRDEAEPAPQEQPVSVVRTVARPKLFSEEWAQAYRKAINGSMAYRHASTRWEAGSLAFIMKAAPREGFPKACAVILDLHRGECRAARSLPPGEALSEAAFVIEGDFGSWMRVLNGQAQPLIMIILGRLYLRKGSLAQLLPFTQSAQELVHCAQNIS